MMQKDDNSVLILGRAIPLAPIDKKLLNGLTVGDKFSYHYYSGTYQGTKLAFAKPKGVVASPRALAITAQNAEQKFGMPIVYVLPTCPAYLRQRLIDKGVYFIVSDKFAFLPNLVINERIRGKRQTAALSPVAQYILLYHLQVKSLRGMSAQDIKDFIPYSYPSISLGLSCLEDLGLLVRKAVGKNKVIEFADKGKDLFVKSRQYMIDPVEKRIYCDEFNSAAHFPMCGINALSHYTALNPDRERMIAMSKQSCNRLKAEDALIGENQYDGNVMIEVWKYPPVTADGFDGKWVDRLSLALSLADDQDPRVEEEIERLINEMQWSD